MADPTPTEPSVVPKSVERYTVRSYEIDPQGRLHLAALCDYLQESASLHARMLGFSIEQMPGMTWFLHQLRLRLDAPLPDWRDTVVVETWPAELGRPFAIRDYRLWVESEAGGRSPLGVATSAWLLVDVETGRVLRRHPEALKRLHLDPPVRALDVRFRRLPSCPSAEAGRPVHVRHRDLDLNGHLNNVAAMVATLEGVPRDIIDHRQPTDFEIEFIAQGHRDDPLVAVASPAEPEVEDGTHASPDGSDEPIRLIHSLKRRETGEEITRGRSRWIRADSHRHPPEDRTLETRSSKGDPQP